MILFGVRSPLVVDFEETLLRAAIPLTAAVNVNGTPRLLDRAKLVDLATFAAPPGAPFIACAFSPQRRAELVAQARSLGLELAPALIDPTAIVPRSFRAGAGSYVNAGTVFGGMTFLGECVLVNRAASLGHHTILGDRVTIGPGATLAGNIRVGEAAVIGAGSTIFPHVTIGAGAVVSAGSVVRKDVGEGMLVAGNPALAKGRVPRKSSLTVEDEE